MGPRSRSSFLLACLLVFSSLSLTQPSFSAEVTCTPSAGFTNCVRVTYSGSDQTFTVPNGFVAGNYLHAEVWGAGGGGSTYGGAYSPNSGGGAGGYSKTAISGIEAGDVLTIVVGQGGQPNTLTRAYGGGGTVGQVATSGVRGSGGGGLSAIFLDSQKAMPLVVAGGGGGGSPGSNAAGNPGGGGGIGNAPATGTEAGRPATTTAGGAAFNNSGCTPGSTAGASYLGGNGAGTGEPGGGGGGGYYGGGGGRCQASGTVQNGGGGGGSGFVSSSALVLAHGDGGAGPLGGAGSVAAIGKVLPASGGQYVNGIGAGGPGNSASAGGNGMVVFQWTTVPQPAAGANPDESSGKSGVAQSIAAVQTNDTLPVGFSWVVSSIRLCSIAEVQVATPSRSCTIGNNVSMRSTVQSQGQYNLNTATGLVRFTPDSTFSGIATPVTYQIQDSSGRVFWSTYTPTLAGPPTMSPDSSTADFGIIQQVAVLTNDAAHSSTTFDNTTLKICASNALDTSCTATSMQVTNVGKFEVVAPANVKFTPCTANGSPFASPNCTSGFVGSHTIKYRAADALGQTATSSYTITTNPPAIAARGEIKSVLPSSSVSFTAITGSAGLSSGVGLTVCLISSGACAGSNTVTVSGEGTFTLNPANKVVTFVALGTMTAAVSHSVSYRVTDVANQTATAQLVVRAPLPPTANLDSPVGAAGATQTIAVLANDSAGDSSATLDASSLKLCPSTTSLAADCNLQTVTIAGKGSFVVQNDGTIAFTPVAGFDGTVDSVKYLVRDSLGQSALGTVSATVLPPPAATTVRDQVVASYASATTFSPLGNDSVAMPQSGYSQTGAAAIDSSSLRLCASNNSASSCSDTTITTAAGTYVLNTASNVVTFTPVLGFSGRDLNAPNYSVCISVSGTWAPQTPPNTCSFGSLDVMVSTPPPPTLVNASVSGPMNTPLSVPVTNGASAAAGLAVVTSSARLCLTQVTIAASCSETSLSISEGVFTVDSNTGLVTFVPAAGFSGATPAIKFAVSDTAGNTSMAQLTVSIIAPPATQTLTTTGSENQTQQATITIPQGGSVILLDSSDSPVSNLVVQGGSYSLNSQSGQITFTPDSGFTGVAPTASVRVLDTFGQVTISSYTANVTATPPPPQPSLSPDSFTAVPGSVIFGNVALNDSIPTDATITVVSQPASGSLVIAPDGSFNFTPGSNFTGSVSFDYQVCHPAPNSSVCSVQTASLTFTTASSLIAVTPSIPNSDGTTSPQLIERAAVETATDLPVIAPPAEERVASACLLINSGCAPTASVDKVGKFELTGQGAVEFTPATGFVGDASITRRSTSETGTVILDVVRFEVNPPTQTLTEKIASNETATFVPGDPTIERCLVQQASDVCQKTLEVRGVGTWGMQASGNVVFTPAKNFVGSFSVWLRSTSTSGPSFIELSVSVAKAKPSTKRPPVKLVLTHFADGSPKLSKSFMDRIQIFMKRYSDYSTIRCFGQTEGPTVLRGDLALATARANNSCSYALSLGVGKFSRLGNTTANRLIESPTLRRVVIYLTD